MKIVSNQTRFYSLVINTILFFFIDFIVLEILKTSRLEYAFLFGNEYLFIKWVSNVISITLLGVLNIILFSLFNTTFAGIMLGYKYIRNQNSIYSIEITLITTMLVYLIYSIGSLGIIPLYHWVLSEDKKYSIWEKSAHVRKVYSGDIKPEKINFKTDIYPHILSVGINLGLVYLFTIIMDVVILGLLKYILGETYFFAIDVLKVLFSIGVVLTLQLVMFIKHKTTISGSIIGYHWISTSRNKLSMMKMVIAFSLEFLIGIITFEIFTLYDVLTGWKRKRSFWEKWSNVEKQVTK